MVISEAAVNKMVEWLVTVATEMLLPFMVLGFITGMILRTLIYYTIRREYWFAVEFSKRVDRHISSVRPGEPMGFFLTAKRLLEKTFYEVFEVRGIMMRRKPDYVQSLIDRIFVIQAGCARMVRDTLKQLRYIRHGKAPKLLAVAKHVCETNPCFNKVFGVLPSAPINDFLNVLPGLFIVGGIFGTFLGIMKALPSLGGMDLGDPESSKAVMDEFLLRVAYSMSTSVLGIALSVISTVYYTFCSPSKFFLQIVTQYESSLALLWNRCTHNDIPEQLENFDEHRDPLDALAAQAVDREDAKIKEKRTSDYAQAPEFIAATSKQVKGSRGATQKPKARQQSRPAPQQESPADAMAEAEDLHPGGGSFGDDNSSTAMDAAAADGDDIDGQNEKIS